uniref:Uncharacterized protein n=1 Tax=viral metagenome TaxID=1070528 RepID=A0A6M3KFX5_9ZZZZ
MYTKIEEIIKETETKTTVFNKLEDWRGNCFESSSCKTLEFIAFARAFKAYIAKKAKLNNLQLVNVSTGHFYLCGFFFNPRSGKYAYFSTSDVRYSRDAWWNNVLIRTAQHDKDWTGGGNQYTPLVGIGEMALRLTI